MQFVPDVMYLGSVETVEGCEPSDLPVGYWAYGTVAAGNDKLPLPLVRAATSERARESAGTLAAKVAALLNKGAARDEWAAAVAARRSLRASHYDGGDLPEIVAADRAWDDAQRALLRALGL